MAKSIIKNLADALKSAYDLSSGAIIFPTVLNPHSDNIQVSTFIQTFSSSNNYDLLQADLTNYGSLKNKLSEIDNTLSDQFDETIFPVPICFCGQFCFLIVSKDKKEGSSNLIKAINNLIPLGLLSSISANINDAKLFPQTDTASFFKHYISQLAKTFLPLRIKLNDGQWQDYMFETHHDKTHLFEFNLADEYQVVFELGGLQHSDEAFVISQLQILKQGIESIFQTSYKQWESNHSDLLNPEMLHELTSGIDKYQTLLTEVADYQKSQKKQLDFIRSYINNSNEIQTSVGYEFYKGTQDWIIRFAGEPVRMKRKSETGLRYIHKLLSSPFIAFYPNDLELISENKKHDPLLQISPSISVELNVNSMFSEQNPENEKSILEQLRRLVENKPEQYDKDETHIYYLSQMVYLSHSLKNIVSKASYINLYEDYKKTLDDKIFEFRQLNDDKGFVQRIVTKSKIIKKPVEQNVQNRRLRQRVTKSIKNAINSMDSENIQTYFDNTLTIGVKSCYKPTQENSIDWKLQLD